MTRRKRLAKLRECWGRPSDRARNLRLIAEYHDWRSTPSTSLDDRTWNDLDLDAVFAAVNHTTSTLGEQALYHRLRTTPEPPHRQAFEALATRMDDELEPRERAQLALSRLQSPDAYDLWSLAQPGALTSAPWHALFPVLAVAGLASVAAFFVWHGALFFIAAIAIVNLVIRATTAPQIGPVLGALRQVGPLLAAAGELTFLDGPDTRPLTGPLREHLPHLRRLRTIAGWIGRDPVAAGEIVSSLIGYLNLLFLLDANALYFGERELRTRGRALLDVIGTVGDIDAAIAVASFRSSRRGWIRPRFGAPGSELRAVAVRHPLVADAVANSIVLTPPAGVLITGSNMSGKTTLLRAIGVTSVLAQTINTCLADSYDAPILRVRSCIGRSDDLLSGKSYYLAEVEAVLALVAASARPEPHLLLFDELFRGTNAVERIAGAEAVLAELLAADAEPKGHIVIAATHDMELVELLHGVYASYHFSDTIGPEGLTFDYVLRQGPATTRNAIALLRLNGAPDRLVARALAGAESLDARRRAAAAPGYRQA